MPTLRHSSCRATIAVLRFCRLLLGFSKRERTFQAARVSGLTLSVCRVGRDQCNLDEGTLLTKEKPLYQDKVIQVEFLPPKQHIIVESSDCRSCSIAECAVPD
nr:unnamed protein product [Spirometra erinaceieuropaei]